MDKNARCEKTQVRFPTAWLPVLSPIAQSFQRLHLGTWRARPGRRLPRGKDYGDWHVTLSMYTTRDKLTGTKRTTSMQGS
jgi:hypothetical protein